MRRVCIIWFRTEPPWDKEKVYRITSFYYTYITMFNQERKDFFNREEGTELNVISDFSKTIVLI